MQTFKLNKEQITELIRYKRVYISKNQSVEIYDNELILNKCGNYSYIEKINLQLIEQGKNHGEFFRSLICEHFNIEKNMVICISCELKDSEFKIRFTPDKEISIIICPITEAIKNTEYLYEEKIKIDFENTHQIGPYRRLGNSCYFFRLDIY